MLFSKDEEADIVAAINDLERITTGELRLYVEDFCMRDHPVERAAEIFHLFGMHNTAERNGVLVYLAEKSRHLAIWGDTGINDRVGYEFWDEEKKLLREHLQHDQAAKGLQEVIRQIGQKLQAFFPADPNNPNVNELPDDIIYG